MAAVTRGFRSALYLAALILSVSTLAGCKGGGGGGSSTPATASASSGTPTISGSAATLAPPNAIYTFQPSAADPDGDALSFQIQNKPTWATFNTVTGELSGTPTRAHAGTYLDIVISASDGKASTQLTAFSITVGEAAGGDAGSASVMLSWTAPTQNTDGSQLTDLSGFVISFGSSSDALSQNIPVDNPSIDRFVLDNLEPGTYYFAVRAISASGAESALSQIVTKVVG